MSNAGIIIFIIASVISISWIVGIRKLAQNGGVTRQTVITSMLFSILTITALFSEEIWIFNLLWLFPVSWVIGTLSLAFPLSLLWIPGSIYAKIVTLGTGIKQTLATSLPKIKIKDLEILEKYLGNNDYQHDEKKLNLIQDQIDLSQWQINMEFIIRGIKPRWSGLLGEEDEKILEGATPELKQIFSVGLNSGNFPFELNEEILYWFIAAYPDVLNFFYPSPDYDKRPIKEEFKRVEKQGELIEPIMDDFQSNMEEKYKVDNQLPNKEIVYLELKNYYKNELKKRLLLSK